MKDLVDNAGYIDSDPKLRLNLCAENLLMRGQRRLPI